MHSGFRFSNRSQNLFHIAPLTDAAIQKMAMSFISAYSPGRVEHLGNHTDYNEGYVLSVAIDRGVRIEARRREDRRILLRSATMDGKIEIYPKDRIYVRDEIAEGAH
jgi:galactokinase